MLEIEKKRITEALRVLDAYANKGELSYAVEFDGRTFGNREFKPEQTAKKKRGPIHPYGEVARYVDPYLDKIAEGGAIAIPCGPYTLATLRGNVSARCVLRFGKGKANVMTNTDNGTLEVLVDPNGVTSLRAAATPAETQIEMFDDGPTAA